MAPPVSGRPFVGHGVDVPLGVTGTWIVRDPAIARVGTDRRTVAGLGTVIYGASGAEAP